MTRDFVVFSGTSNPGLAAAVSAELGVPPGRRTVSRFPDGEVEVRLDESVRGREVLLVQPTGPPVNDNLIELLALADACRRSAAARITAVVPYFGYARADRRRGRREPITASLVAQLIQAAGIDHLVTVDLHAGKIEGFFRIPVDSLTAVPTLGRRSARALAAGGGGRLAGYRPGRDGHRLCPPARRLGRHPAQAPVERDRDRRHARRGRGGATGPA